MAVIRAITPITLDGDHITILGPYKRRTYNYMLQVVRRAFHDGHLERLSAGPGWGRNNAVLKPAAQNEHPQIEEPWWGTWLAEIIEIGGDTDGGDTGTVGHPE